MPLQVNASPRVAIVHDYLTQRGGAERVALAAVRALPGATLLTSVYEPSRTFPEFAQIPVQRSWLDKVPLARTDPRLAMPMMASTFQRMRVDNVDAVLCSSSGWSHGVQTDAPKIVYCHNPARWIYQPDDYFGAMPPAAQRGFRLLVKRLRAWDQEAARSAATYLVNSTIVAARVLRHYGIQARVLPPPAGLLPDGPMEPVPGIEPGYLLTVGRRRSYKNTSAAALAVAAMPDEQLVIVGGLPDHPSGADWPSRIVGLEDLRDAQLRWLYANARGLIAVAHEDFGLTPVEAFGFGTPVLALRAGGYLDTCRDGLSGTWIHEASPAGVMDAVERFDATTFDAERIREHAQRWTPERFARDLNAVVDRVVSGEVETTMTAGLIAS